MDNNVIKLIKQLDSILIGKNEIIKKIVANILVGGNILLEDMPGVGKTIIAKALARSIASDEKGTPIKFSRIQGTPDLLPYDITGVDIFDNSKNKFIFNPGPVFTDILLVDELTRTTPKVQSALLQAMAEKEVTVGKRTYTLSKMFCVIATQNPVETEGTYPLPAAQLDRFTSCLKIGYPDLIHELIILDKGKSEDRLIKLKPVITVKKILNLRDEIKKIEVNKKIQSAIANICNITREYKDIRLGLSTRAGLMMMEMLRAKAYLNDRDYVIDQDLTDFAAEIWSHRIILLNPQLNPKDIISKITRIEARKLIN